jgi:hypothetical protein
VKVTVIVQLTAGGRTVPQVLVWLKSAAFVPVTAILLMFNATPALSVTFCAVLLVPTN